MRYSSIVIDAIAGVLIGAVNVSWWAVLIASAVWGLVVWFYVAVRAGQATYKPDTPLLFGSPRLSRFVVWWISAFSTSAIAGSIIYAVRPV
jgi:hypothetical protein